jgi:hypothetical protein
MRILFVASLHHPEELQAAIDATPPDAPAPLFPPSMAQHSWEKALRRRGHTLGAFYRNQSAFGSRMKAHYHSQGLTPAKVATALAQRLPPTINLDYRLRNRRLLAHARAFRPDILWMTGDNTTIYAETLAAIKQETGCKLIYACGTSPIVFSHAIDRRAARLYDLVLASDFYHGIQWLELGARRMECLPLSACDPELHRRYELTEAERQAYTCDIAFVGTLVPDNLYSLRIQALEALRDFDLGIWSVHEVPPSLAPYLRGEALGERTLRILSASKISINTHGDFVRYGGNIRLFEAAGAGSFQIADDLPGVGTWFKAGENIVTYRDLADLREKVAYYLKHDDEREQLASHAQTHVYRHHTYDHRAQCLEALIEAL